MPEGNITGVDRLGTKGYITLQFRVSHSSGNYSEALEVKQSIEELINSSAAYSDLQRETDLDIGDLQAEVELSEGIENTTDVIAHIEVQTKESSIGVDIGDNRSGYMQVSSSLCNMLASIQDLSADPAIQHIPGCPLDDPKIKTEAVGVFFELNRGTLASPISLRYQLSDQPIGDTEEMDLRAGLSGLLSQYFIQDSSFEVQGDELVVFINQDELRVDSIGRTSKSILNFSDSLSSLILTVSDVELVNKFPTVEAL